MKKQIFIITGIVCLVMACTKDRMPTLIELDNQLSQNIEGASPDGTLDYYVLPQDDLDAIPQDPKNPLTRDKVELGKFMFFDTGLAMGALKEEGLGTYSCASCHIPEAGFRPGNFQGVADGGIGFGLLGENRLRNTEYLENELDVQSARPLSMVNVAYVKNTFWNGQFGGGGVNVGTEGVWDLLEDTERNHQGFEGIETQNFEGLITHRITINKELLEDLGYLEMYDGVFGDVPEEDRYTIRTASFAFSAYIRSIISDKAPFQEWLQGNKRALSADEKNGAILFFGKAQCYNCHYQQNLGSLEFHALGVNDMDQIPSYNTSPDDRRNLGRGGFTLREEDNYKFKVPGLYNIGDSEHYFHGASKRTLEEVIEYKILAEGENPRVPEERISEKFNTLVLSETEKAQLLVFLKNGLRDPDLIRYQPTSVPSGSCFPNNDYQSRLDLGCY
ncbi:MAG: cytochrome-c peroxidase [Saprospiraceae bacterium]|nr:cytochrome-c peroxidase [Saprospiraceae bacterium]